MDTELYEVSAPAGETLDDIFGEPVEPAPDPIDDVFVDEPVPTIEDEDNYYYLEKILQKLLRMFGA